MQTAGKGGLEYVHVYVPVTVRRVVRVYKGVYAHVCTSKRKVDTCVNASKSRLEWCPQEWCLAVKMDVRTYNQGVISKKVESYPLNSTLPSLGYSIWNPWNGGWRLMDSMEFPDHSMDFPDGFHIIPWNFQIIPWNFQMDSILFKSDSCHLKIPYKTHM